MDIHTAGELRLLAPNYVLYHSSCVICRVRRKLFLLKVVILLFLYKESRLRFSHVISRVTLGYEYNTLTLFTQAVDQLWSPSTTPPIAS